MKTMKKITALFLALALVLALCATAFSVEIGTDGIASTGGNTLKFKKSILMKNGNSTQVREPAITYTYTITEIETLAAGTTVTDVNSNTGTVYKLTTENGTLNSVLPTTTATAVFSDTNKVETSATGVETTEEVEFTFDGAAFPHAGIYRFVVTETCSPAKTAVGITENSNYTNHMYLDVYVEGQGTTTAIYAYVLFENNDANIAANDNTLAARQKSAGWAGGDTGTINQDIYQTYDLEVKKAISGDTTSQNHQFPFTVTLANTNLTTKVDLALSDSHASYNSTYSVASDTLGNYAALSSSTVIRPDLANNGTLTITGIPAGTTVTVKETNNTYDFYALSATKTVGSTVTNLTEANGSIAPGGESSPTSAIEINGETITHILFGNNLTQISPTGYVTRYAPYGLMLIAGVILLVIVLKRRKHSDEE